MEWRKQGKCYTVKRLAIKYENYRALKKNIGGILYSELGSNEKPMRRNIE